MRLKEFIPSFGIGGDRIFLIVPTEARLITQELVVGIQRSEDVFLILDLVPSKREVELFVEAIHDVGPTFFLQIPIVCCVAGRHFHRYELQELRLFCV